MIGAFLNAIGILVGGLLGLVLRRPLSLRVQVLFRSALGTAVFFFGLRLVWLSLGGSFLVETKQILIALLAVSVGFWLGKFVRLQKLSNRLGRPAATLIASSPTGAGKTAEAWKACVLLFSAAPLGLIGAVADGLAGYFWLLAVKAVMDALAMMSFVKLFRWPVALSAFPVFVVLGGITLACEFCAPWLAAHHCVSPINAAAGLIACAVTVVIFEVRRVELANFLPALVVAPLLARCFGWTT